MDYNEYQKNKSKIYAINDLDDLARYIKKDIKEGAGLVYVMINTRFDSYNKALISDISKLTDKLIGLGYSPKVSFGIQELDIDDEEMENIIDYGIALQRSGGDVCFNQDIYTEYTLEEVVDAQINSSSFIKNIQALNVSPLEMFIIVQNYVTSRDYKENEQDPESARDLIKVLNGQDIVCVGYASMMEYILTELGIKCVSQQCEILDKNSREHLGYHVNNIVYLDDKKYGVNGWYYVDACWDCKGEREEPYMRYNFSLIPLKDVEYIRKKEVRVSSGFCGALYSLKERSDMYTEIVDFTSAAERMADESGMIDEFNEQYEYLDSPDVEMQERRTYACGRLREILKAEGVSSSFFSSEDIPIESSFPVLLANLMQEKVDEVMLEKSIDGLRLYKKLLEEGTVENTEYIKAEPSVDNVYGFLNRFEKGEILPSEECDCLIKVEEKLRDIKFAALLDSIVVRAKIKSKPISLSIYKKAIENANVAQGMPIKYAEIQAERAVDYSVKLSEKLFDEKATNCFRKEALKRRREREETL